MPKGNKLASGHEHNLDNKMKPNYRKSDVNVTALKRPNDRTNGKVFSCTRSKTDNKDREPSQDNLDNDDERLSRAQKRSIINISSLAKFKTNKARPICEELCSNKNSSG